MVTLQLPCQWCCFQIDASSLTGNSVSTSVTTTEHGSLWYRPIPGDMLNTIHSDPQVPLLFPCLCGTSPCGANLYLGTCSILSTLTQVPLPFLCLCGTSPCGTNLYLETCSILCTLTQVPLPFLCLSVCHTLWCRPIHGRHHVLCPV